MTSESIPDSELRVGLDVVELVVAQAAQVFLADAALADEIAEDFGEDRVAVVVLSVNLPAAFFRLTVCVKSIGFALAFGLARKEAGW